MASQPRSAMAMTLAAVTLAAGALLAVPAKQKPATRAPGLPAPYTVEGKVSEPRIFGEGIISTVDNEQGGTFSPDGSEFYFTKVGAYTTFPRYSIICVSRFSAGKWSTPEVVPFSGRTLDLPPRLSPDGNKMYFASARPLAGAKIPVLRIWSVERTATGWGEPKALEAPVNAPEDRWNLDPSVTSDGTLYFTSDREKQFNFHIYRARLVDGKYAEPEKLGPAINSEFNEAQPFISADEKILVFSSTGLEEQPFPRRPEEIETGGKFYLRGDLYVSVNRGGEWTAAKHLEHDINSFAEESYPSLTPDGRYLFFSSERNPFTVPTVPRLTHAELDRKLRTLWNGQGNIFFVGIEALELPQ